MTVEDHEALPPAWEEVLAGVAGDLDAADALLASLRDGTPDPPPAPSLPWSAPVAPPTAPPTAPPSGLDDRQRAALRRRLHALNARSLAVVSRLSAARAENRRHRALLERAESAHDRPVYVDRQA